MNVLTISGNIGRDAEVRNAGGSAVAGFSLAMKSGFGDKAQTIWVDCSIWGKQAESGLVQYLKKGQFVVVSGDMGTREHDGKTYITLRVNSVTLGGKQSEKSSPPAQQGYAQQPAQNAYAPQPQQQQGYAPAPQQRPAPQPQAQQQAPAQNFTPDLDDGWDDDIPFSQGGR